MCQVVTENKEILSVRLLQVRQKSNFSGDFKLELVTTWQLGFICENFVNITFLKKRKKKRKRKRAIHKKFHNSWVDKLLLVLI